MLSGPTLLNAGGQASFSTSSLSAGSHTITAEYGGTSNFIASSGSVVQQVNAPPPQPSIVINNITVREPRTGTINGFFTVSLSASSSQTVTVNFATANGTATAGSDYVAASGVVTFTPGQTSRTITVTINADSVNENNETFFMNLSGAVNATISDSQGVCTVRNR